MNQSDRIHNWASRLQTSDRVDVICDLVSECINAEVINFYKHNLAPYWDGNGEPLVEGQQTHEDE